MNRIIFISLVILSILLISGCTSNKEPVDPVNPDNVSISSIYVSMAEFKEQNVKIVISNNADKPIDSVTVTSFGKFGVDQSGTVNIPGRTDDASSSASISFQARSPGFTAASDTTDLTISYASGMNEKRKPIVQTKTVPVETFVYPDAELQSVGFVKDMQHLLDPRMEKWELKKGENTSISFYVINNGQTTIDEDTLVVRYNVENERIGGNDSFSIDQAMARSGTSYTTGLFVPVKKDSPNGETDVIVSLLYKDRVIDSEVLTLKVKL
ncbi:MAG: hypothetical protein SCH39_01420 [Methanosarcinales archaeon]|nr:hypothetical protein [Methanosarcinales archaeon]